MTEWIVRDDGRYRRWLDEHPDGFVINTWASPKASYLVLHKASCRSVNRPSDDRLWTVQYGKAVSSEPAELVRWAREVTRGTPRDCQLCGGAQGTPGR